MDKQENLFAELPTVERSKIEFGQLRSPVWTDNKAQLIAKYLYYFVLITKHGAYIDGFSAPKNRKEKSGWAANLVLSQEPKFLKEFYFCDIDPDGVKSLEELIAQQPSRPKRHIELHTGDFNEKVHDILKSNRLTESKATFCLIDQFAFECNWKTLEALASHKKRGNKIELFYFLCTGWLDRGLAGFKKNLHIPEQWWGNDQWKTLAGMDQWSRALLVCERFKNELGYKYAHPWAIYEKGSTGKIMFHMIHATDHDAAPKIMYRAYKNATKADEPTEILQRDLSELWDSSKHC